MGRKEKRRKRRKGEKGNSQVRRKKAIKVIWMRDNIII